MDFEANKYLLDQMLLDANQEPTDLLLSLLKDITNNFSEDRKIGIGGFADVFEGRLDNGSVAVKRLTQAINMDENNFNKEVTNLMRVRHQNVVRFLGYCADTQGKVAKYGGKMVVADVQQRLLCFEFLPGCLDKHLSNVASGGLEWRTRYQIIKGLCRGLHYLHRQNIVHLDLKPANILLDSNMVPKISDFGLSRCFEENQTRAITAKVVGTQGYMAPEFINNGVITMKADIYSLGIIIIEILEGRKAYLRIESVRRKWEETSGSGSEEHKEINKYIELALNCIVIEPDKRPSMEQVTMILGISEDDMNHHGIEEHRLLGSEIIEDLGLREDTNPHPIITEEQSVINIDSSEVDPLLGSIGGSVTSSPIHIEGASPPPSRPHLQEERHDGLHRRYTKTANKEGSPPEILKRTLLRRMMEPSVCGVPMAYVIIALVVDTVLLFSLVAYAIPSYEMSRTVSITVEEASFTRFALATSSPVLTYNLSVMMGIYNPSMYVPKVTKPLEAAFFFGGQRFHVLRFDNNGEYLITTLISMGPLSGNVTLDTAGVAEYRKETSTGLYEVVMVVVGQVMYSGTFTICKVQATCPFKLRLAPPDGTTELELFQKVKCPLHRNCSSSYE